MTRTEPAKSEFDSAMAQAGSQPEAMTQALAAGQTQPTQAVMQGAAPEGGAKLVRTEEQEKSSRLMSAAEKSPLTQKKAVSSTTAPAIAGLKPWGANWVFAGDEKNNPGLKPLFGEAAKPEAKQDLTRGETATAGKALESVGAPSAPNPHDLIVAMNAQKRANSVQSHLTGTAQIPGLESSFESMDETSQQAKPAFSSQLGGSQFLDTLNSVQGGEKSFGAGSQFGSDAGQSQLARQPRPELRVVEGGLKPNPAGFGESLQSTSKLKPAMKKEEEIGSLSSLNGGSLSSLQASSQSNGSHAPAEVTGHVVKGSMSQERLSSESLLGLSTQMRNLAAKGGGDIRIRLKPENLGELHVRVMTNGRDVGLQIQATDEKAKRILEESLGSLKDGLASQNLTLGKVDLSVAGAKNLADSGNQSQNHQAQSGWMGQNLEQGSQSGFGQRGSFDEEASESIGSLGRNSKSSAASLAAASGASRRSSSSAANGRLDLMA